MEEFILGFPFKCIYLCALGKASGSHRLTSPEKGGCTIVPGHWPPLHPTLPAYANLKRFPPLGRGYEAAVWEEEEVCPSGCLQAPEGLYGFVADVRPTSLAHELGSMPCSVSVFAICHSLAPSLSKFSSRISCLRALGWGTGIRAYCAFFFFFSSNWEALVGPSLQWGHVLHGSDTWGCCLLLLGVQVIQLWRSSPTGIHSRGVKKVCLQLENECRVFLTSLLSCFPQVPWQPLFPTICPELVSAKI